MATQENLDSRFGDFVNNVTRKYRSESQYEFSTPEIGEREFAKNGLYQKICSIPAQDAIKNGYEICSSNEDIINNEETSKINKVLYDFDIDAKIAEAVTFNRATGGAVLFLKLDDGEKIDAPVNYNRLVRLYGVNVYNASEVLPFTYYSNYSDVNFGEVEKYTITDGKTGNSFAVHSSRLLIFDGLTTTGRVRSARDGWGGMVFDNIKDELSRYDSANRLSISILSRLSQGILKIEGLKQAVNAGEGEKMTKYLEYTDSMRSIMNTLLLDGSDNFDLKNMTLSGYKDIIEQQVVALSAVSQIPITILFGRSPAGMNSTGDADLETYYSLVKRIQTNDMQKNLESLIKIITKCKDYKIAENDYHISFNEVKLLNAKEKAEIENKKADSLVKIANAVETLHELGAIDNDEIAEYLDTRTDFPINHNYGGGDK